MNKFIYTTRMLSGGKADSTDQKDTYIKHIHCFEGKTICKLIHSKDYLGRGCVSKRDSTKYIKNKELCNLIDKLRYSDKRCAKEKSKPANLHYVGFVNPYLSGGGADATYGFGEKLDLGGAGPRPGVIFEPHIGNS